MTAVAQEKKETTIRLSKSLEANVALIKHEFEGDGTLVNRSFENSYNPGVSCSIFYTDGMVNSQFINDNIVAPVTAFSYPAITKSIVDFLMEKVLQVDDAKKTRDFDDIAEAIVYGDTVLLVQGSDEALVLNTKGWPKRGISEPEGEKVLHGPREGFSEGLMGNLAMVRRKLKTRDLKIKFRKFGKETQTKACVCWIGRLAKKEVLDELERRLDRFDMDGALDVNYLTEYIKDAPYSVFKTVGSTERPDIVAAKLLEGRVAVFLDGTPEVITVPYLFIENFQSNEDYYMNFWYSSFTRFLRIVAFALTITIPAFYVAIVTTQQEELPTPMLLTIAVARQDVPFPTILEALVMIFLFEILKETGIRVNSSIGQAVSIVGALVVGQAAVEARIASSPMIIVVAMTGITGLLIPRLSTAVTLLRALYIIICAVLGVFGLVMGLIGLLIYLVELKSFGLPCFHNPSKDPQRHVDTFVRAPWWLMETRPTGMSNDQKRMGKRGRPRQ